MSRVLPAALVALALAMPARAGSPAVSTVAPPPLRMVAASGTAEVPVAVAPVPAVLTPLAPWLPLIRSTSAADGLPWRMVAALVLVESGGNPSVVSATGAEGLAQVEPATGHAEGFFGLRSPVVNLMAATAYLAHLGRLYGVTAGCWQEGTAAGGACGWVIDEVLSGYNAGPGGAYQAAYVRRVRAEWVVVEGAA